MRKDRRAKARSLSSEVCQGRAEVRPSKDPERGRSASKRGCGQKRAKKGSARSTGGREENGGDRKVGERHRQKRVGERASERLPPFAPPDHGRLRLRRKLAGFSPVAAPAASTPGGLAQRED